MKKLSTGRNSLACSPKVIMIGIFLAPPGAGDAGGSGQAAGQAGGGAVEHESAV